MTSAALPGCRAGRMYGSLELTTLVHRRRDQVNGSGSQRAQTQGASTWPSDEQYGRYFEE